MTFSEFCRILFNYAEQEGKQDSYALIRYEFFILDLTAFSSRDISQDVIHSISRAAREIY